MFRPNLFSDILIISCTWLEASLACVFRTNGHNNPIGMWWKSLLEYLLLIFNSPPEKLNFIQMGKRLIKQNDYFHTYFLIFLLFFLKREKSKKVFSPRIIFVKPNCQKRLKNLIEKNVLDLYWPSIFPSHW